LGGLHRRSGEGSRLSIAAALAVLAAFASTDRIHAASQQPFDLDQMVGLSEEIVVGRVVQSRPRWEGRLIVTVATVDVEESIKGAAPARIEIVELGGSAVHPETGLEVTMTASTQVSLEVGEDVLLFVHHTAAGLRQLVGAQQGSMVIRRDETTGLRVLPAAPKQLEVERGAARSTVRAETMTLDTMRARIRARLGSGPARGAREGP